MTVQGATGLPANPGSHGKLLVKWRVHISVVFPSTLCCLYLYNEFMLCNVYLVPVLCLIAAQSSFMIVTEAEYMYRLRKDIIPLVLEPGYVPDGWLGILIGTKLFFDLSRPATFDAELDRLILEVGSRGRLPSSVEPLASATASNSSCLHCQ